MNGFHFRDRRDCICGLVLKGRQADLVVPSFWGAVTYTHCPSCGSWVQSPQIDERSLALWYDSPQYQGSDARSGAGYDHYLADEDARLTEARARCAADLQSFLPNRGSILEVGCATGSLLAVLREAGHSVTGIDLSETFVAFGRERHSVDIRCGDFLSADFEPASFDMVLMLGTISNLADPQAHLRHAHTLLKPAGVLFFNLPLADSLIARAYGQRFWMFTPSVSSFMSRRGLLALLERSGFRAERLRSDRQRPSVGKLLNHARVSTLLALARCTGLARLRLPFAIPVPGVASVWARRL